MIRIFQQKDVIILCWAAGSSKPIARLRHRHGSLSRQNQRATCAELVKIVNISTVQQNIRFSDDNDDKTLRTQQTTICSNHLKTGTGDIAPTTPWNIKWLKDQHQIKNLNLNTKNCFQGTTGTSSDDNQLVFVSSQRQLRHRATHSPPSWQKRSQRFHLRVFRSSFLVESLRVCCCNLL